MNEVQISNDDGDFDPALSPAGIIRRGQILELARKAAGKRRTRKAAGRVAGVAVVSLIVALIFTWTLRPTDPGPQISIKPTTVVPTPITPGLTKVIATAPVLPAASDIQITWIATEHGIADRLAVPPAAPIWTRLSDSELMQDIAATGQPGGLAYVNDRPVLLFQFDSAQ